MATATRPHLGIYFDLGEFPTDYAAATAFRRPEPHGWRDILAKARLAEELGFDSVWVPDHLIFGADEGVPEGFWECTGILAALAATTERIGLGALVACAAFRSPALLAKVTDTIDEISGGRLTLGLGAGFYEPEFRAFGYPFDRLAGRFDEALQIIHGLLRHGAVDFEGRFYSARECELRPRGPRPDGPPLLIAARGPRTMRLAAQYGDLWNEVFVNAEPDHLTRLRDLSARLDEACASVGREPGTLGRSAAVFVQPRPGAGDEWQRDGQLISGPPAGIARFVGELTEAGVSHVIFIVAPQSIEGIAAMAPVLEELGR